jgi:hypothetical protein
MVEREFTFSGGTTYVGKIRVHILQAGRFAGSSPSEAIDFFSPPIWMIRTMALNCATPVTAQ